MTAIDRILAGVRGRPAAEPVPATVIELPSPYGDPLAVGVYIPHEPIPPAGAVLCGYMVHTIEGAMHTAGYDVPTPEAAARELVTRGTKHHAIYALAMDRGEDGELGFRAEWDAPARRWKAWRAD
ncbi:MAG TPA: hypothetical protein VH092_18585 [Urbifossiella sp.]|jgi:hypothetical protein|nr:hypothetical protein [Urbifossiella sp.]